MKLEISGNEITIHGNIKTLNDAEEIRNAIESLSGYSSIRIRIPDSISITSSVIGHLNKALDKGITIYMEVGNEMLKELLDDLGLTSIFHVTKV